MKRILLSLATVFLVLNSNAQTYSWIFGNDPVDFPITEGYKSVTTIKGLTITPKNPMDAQIADNFGTTDNSDPITYDGVTYPNRFRFNGCGYGRNKPADLVPDVSKFDPAPLQRFISFPVDGDITLKVLAMIDNTATAYDESRLFFTDGNKELVGTVICTQGAAAQEATITYEGSATTLYAFCNAPISLYYIKTATVGTSIDNPNAYSNIIRYEYFDTAGKKLKGKPIKGFYIESGVKENGLRTSRKMGAF